MQIKNTSAIFITLEQHEKLLAAARIARDELGWKSLNELLVLLEGQTLVEDSECSVFRVPGFYSKGFEWSITDSGWLYAEEPKKGATIQVLDGKWVAESDEGGHIVGFEAENEKWVVDDKVSHRWWGDCWVSEDPEILRRERIARLTQYRHHSSS